MLFKIDSNLSAAPFEQLKEQIIAQIASGDLPIDTKLPAIRALATELGLAVNTVARSYKELEQEGFVLTQGRSGTRVNKRAISVDRALAQEAHVFVAGARELGVSTAQIKAALKQALIDDAAGDATSQ